MRTSGLLLVTVLLFAGAVHAVNTAATLNDKRWGQSQESLVGDVGPWNGGVAGSSGHLAEGSVTSDGVLGSVLEAHPDLSAIHAGDPAASTALGNENGAGQLAGGMINGAGGAADWTSGQRWNADSKRDADAGFVNANSGLSLPAFAEIDWMSAPLPIEMETSVMEMFVFPALGAAVFILLTAALVGRLRRRRSLSQTEQLLHA